MLVFSPQSDGSARVFVNRGIEAGRLGAELSDSAGTGATVVANHLDGP